MIRDLVIKSRSYRRFYGEKKIEAVQLRELVDLARLSPSGANRQTLKYILVHTPEMNEKVFGNLGWAGYLKDWNGPVQSERPAGYIIMLADKSLGEPMDIDKGIAAQSIFLGATEMGLGGCFLGNIRKDNLRQVFEIDDKYDIALVIALGYPKEEVVVENLKEDGDVKYWRDEHQVHHVPKRSLDQLIIKER